MTSENSPIADTLPSAASGSGALASGDMLGAYRVDALLGEGGMGTVYLAEHTGLGRKVAIKVLKADLQSDPSAFGRFLAEARAVNRLEHRNVIEITDIFEGTPTYFIMELLKGESLDERLQRQRPLPLAGTIDILIDVAAALGAVEEEEIVHGDVKPENIFVARRGAEEVVKLLDFGIATLPGETPPLSRAGTSGTPAYMSPEQCRGEQLDNRSDIYSFGATFYEVLTGKLPFDGNSIEEMRIKHLSVTPTAPSKLVDLPEAVAGLIDGLVADMLAKEINERPSSMREVEMRLVQVVRALDTSKAAPADPHVESGKRRMFMAAGGAAALAVAVLLWMLSSGPGVEPAAQKGAVESAVTEPEKREQIKLNFDSSPRGAMVYRKGQEEALGVTRLTIEVESSDSEAEYIIKLKGYEPVSRVVPHRSTGSVVVQMTPEPSPAKTTTTKPPKKARKARRPRKRKSKGGTGVKNPFD